MFCGKEMAERRRVMRKWVRGSEDDDEGDVAGVVARDRHWAFAEDVARERRAAESIVGNDERRALVAVQHSEERLSRTHVTYACVPALKWFVASNGSRHGRVHQSRRVSLWSQSLLARCLVSHALAAAAVLSCPGSVCTPRLASIDALFVTRHVRHSAPCE